ncbi:MAG TPA: hypothetical protein DCK79_03800 [Candidatus Atribacteria bacterium]|nr:hypothetical protein [Candidatus Atribacteria bacterium]
MDTTIKRANYTKSHELYGVDILTNPIHGRWDKGYLEEDLFPELAKKFGLVIETANHETTREDGIWSLYYIATPNIQTLKKFLKEIEMEVI